MLRKYISSAVVAGVICLLSSCDGEYSGDGGATSVAPSDYTMYGEAYEAEPAEMPPAGLGVGPGQGGDRFRCNLCEVVDAGFFEMGLF